jgi:hypothetical protein
MGGRRAARARKGEMMEIYGERRVLSPARLKPVGLHEDIKVVHGGRKYRCTVQQQWDALD